MEPRSATPPTLIGRPPVPQRFDARAGKSWKRMLQTAEAKLIEPAFALESLPERYVLKALIPGAQAVRVEVAAAALTVHGTAEERFTDGKSFGYVRQRPVHAVFSLPADADESRVETDVQPGLVQVTIARLPCLQITQVTTVAAPEPLTDS